MAQKKAQVVPVTVAIPILNDLCERYGGESVSAAVSFVRQRGTPLSSRTNVGLGNGYTLFRESRRSGEVEVKA